MKHASYHMDWIYVYVSIKWMYKYIYMYISFLEILIQVLKLKSTEHPQSTYKQKFSQGSNFDIISEALQLAKIVYRFQNILLGPNVLYNIIIKNCKVYFSLNFDTKFLG